VPVTFPRHGDRHGHRRPDEPGLHGLRRSRQVPMMLAAILDHGAGRRRPRRRARLCLDQVQGRRRPAGRQDRSHPAADAVRPVRLPGCKPYAEAIAEGEAEINLCPPGGMEGVRKLADLLGREVKPLEAEEKPKQVAIIDEADLHRLHAVHPGLPGRRHRRRRQADAHHHRIAVHRLRAVRQTLPGRMHHDGSRSPRNLDNWKWKYPVIEIKRAAAEAKTANAGSNCSNSRAASSRRPTRRRRCRQPIGQAPIPSRCRAAASEHRRRSPNPLVEAGEHVLKGQRSAAPTAGCRRPCMRRPPAPSSPSRSMRRRRTRRACRP
jgi:hypothetical protein